MATADTAALATAFRIVKVRACLAVYLHHWYRVHLKNSCLCQGAAARVLGLPIGQTTSHMKFVNASTGSLGLKLTEPVRAAPSLVGPRVTPTDHPCNLCHRRHQHRSSSPLSRLSQTPRSMRVLPLRSSSLTLLMHGHSTTLPCATASCPNQALSPSPICLPGILMSSKRVQMRCLLRRRVWEGSRC